MKKLTVYEPGVTPEEPGPRSPPCPKCGSTERRQPLNECQPGDSVTRGQILRIDPGLRSVAGFGWGSYVTVCPGCGRHGVEVTGGYCKVCDDELNYIIVRWASRPREVCDDPQCRRTLRTDSQQRSRQNKAKLDGRRGGR